MTSEGFRARSSTSSFTAVVLAGTILVSFGWTILWTVDSYWNPIAFTALWTGVAILAWQLSPTGHPGLRRHLALAAISIPCWWWFELVNARVHNWQYVYTMNYSDLAYTVLSSFAFATVVPAVTAVYRAEARLSIESDVSSTNSKPRLRLAWSLVALGVIAQAAVFAWPNTLYPLVWVAPFLIVDGMLTGIGGRGIVPDLLSGHARRALLIAAAGLTCGVLWEFWNFWSTPHWVYILPAVDFGHIFEMPILGYGGYIPFAWFVIELVEVVDHFSVGHQRTGASAPAEAT